MKYTLHFHPRAMTKLLIALLCCGMLTLLFMVALSQAQPPVIYRNGTLTENEVWTSEYVYVINGDLTVPTGITLTIGSDTVVKFQYQSDYHYKRRLTIDGTLDLQGTASNPVVLTSDRDDDYGGDSNGDLDATSPARGDWGHIRFRSSSGNNLFEHALVRYGGYRYDSGYRNYALWVDSAWATIRNNAIARVYVSTAVHFGLM